MNVARNAITILAERGWNKGHLVGPNNEVCFAGALLMGSGLDMDSLFQRGIWETPDLALALKISNDVAEEQFPDRTEQSFSEWQVVRFNDHPETTISEVITVMEKTAIKLDEQV